MEDFSNLTDEQIYALTNDQVERYIDLECAKKGIRLLPDLVPSMPILEKPETNMTVYEVGDFKVLTQGEVDILLEALDKVRLVRLDYEYATGYDNKYVMGMSDQQVKVEHIRCYSPEAFSKVKESLISYTKAKQEYQSNWQEYQKILGARKDAGKWIMEKVEEAQEKYARTERLKTEFARYLTLAQGNVEIARNFLKSAFGLDDEDVLAFGE
jgi:hypothetical protein